MRFSVLALAHVSFWAAAAAEADGHKAAATFSTNGRHRDVDINKCTNFEKSEPIYKEMDIYRGNDCALFDDRDCLGKGKGYASGKYNVKDAKFKSVACYSAH